MVRKSTEKSEPLIAPFLTKCYEMVEDESTDEIISWAHTNTSFVIWDQTHFTLHLLPKYFKHSNFSSFMRQLNIYGFRKIDSDRWEFANDGFIRGQKYLLRNIVRRKHGQTMDNQRLSEQNENTTIECEYVENKSLLKEVEILKTDKNALMQELVKLRQIHETTENKVIVLRDRLQGMEKNQQQMLSFLVTAMQNPSVLVQLLHPKENTWHVPEANIFEDVKSTVPDGTIVRFQGSMPLLTQTSDSVELPDFDFPTDISKEFFKNVEFSPFQSDETLYSENNGPLVLPDYGEDEFLKQMLLAAPLLEKGVDPYPNLEVGSDVGKFEGFESLSREMERNQQLEDDSEGKVEQLDLLTEEMELLISETSSKFNQVFTSYS